MTRLIWILLAASLGAAPPDPVKWKLESSPQKAVKPGGRFTVKLVARIEEGWHMYSLRPMENGPIATRIWLAEGQPFQLADALKAPDPQTLLDPAFNMEVELYEGEAVFTLPVRVTPGTASGEQHLVASASYQSCNNSMCLPPKTVTVDQRVMVAK